MRDFSTAALCLILSFFLALSGCLKKRANANSKSVVGMNGEGQPSALGLLPLQQPALAGAGVESLRQPMIGFVECTGQSTDEAVDKLAKLEATLTNGSIELSADRKIQTVSGGKSSSSSCKVVGDRLLPLSVIKAMNLNPARYLVDTPKTASGMLALESDYAIRQAFFLAALGGDGSSPVLDYVLRRSGRSEVVTVKAQIESMASAYVPCANKADGKVSPAIKAMSSRFFQCVTTSRGQAFSPATSQQSYEAIKRRLNTQVHAEFAKTLGAGNSLDVKDRNYLLVASSTTPWDRITGPAATAARDLVVRSAPGARPLKLSDDGGLEGDSGGFPGATAGESYNLSGHEASDLSAAMQDTGEKAPAHDINIPQSVDGGPSDASSGQSDGNAAINPAEGNDGCADGLGLSDNSCPRGILDWKARVADKQSALNGRDSQARDDVVRGMLKEKLTEDFFREQKRLPNNEEIQAINRDAQARMNYDPARYLRDAKSKLESEHDYVSKMQKDAEDFAIRSSQPSIGPLTRGAIDYQLEMLNSQRTKILATDGFDAIVGAAGSGAKPIPAGGGRIRSDMLQSTDPADNPVGTLGAIDGEIARLKKIRQTAPTR